MNDIKKKVKPKNKWRSPVYMIVLVQNTCLEVGSFNWLGDTENKVKCQAYMLTFKVPYFQPICDASLLYTR